jgi:hypothetical protein
VRSGNSGRAEKGRSLASQFLIKLVDEPAPAAFDVGGAPASRTSHRVIIRSVWDPMRGNNARYSSHVFAAFPKGST